MNSGHGVQFQYMGLVMLIQSIINTCVVSAFYTVKSLNRQALKLIRQAFWNIRRSNIRVAIAFFPGVCLKQMLIPKHNFQGLQGFNALSVSHHRDIEFPSL